jgi:hypothetical protein
MCSEIDYASSAQELPVNSKTRQKCCSQVKDVFSSSDSYSIAVGCVVAQEQNMVVGLEETLSISKTLQLRQEESCQPQFGKLFLLCFNE